MNHSFPPILTQLHEIEIDYDEDGIDFEPYQAFMPAEEQAEWLRAWTGNKQAHLPLLVFGQDGTGGYAAFWLANEDAELLDQPIVFLGSEGQQGVVAACFSDYLWLLASGHGPLEAIEFLDPSTPPNPAFRDFANKHATTPESNAEDILNTAQRNNPTFEEIIEELCG